MDQPLHLAVIAAAAWAAGTLAWVWLGVRGFGRRVLLAPPAGDPAAGVRYAFTAAMLPWAKESVRMHLPSYATGIVFHLGTFVAFGLLAATVAGFELPPALAPAGAIVMLAGAGAGLALLVKRIATPFLRGLSSPDDFIANLLTTSFGALAAVTLLHPQLESAWLITAVVLLVYLPVGKIRHCVVFFSSRAYMGAFFGYRGTFPSARQGR